MEEVNFFMDMEVQTSTNIKHILHLKAFTEDSISQSRAQTNRSSSVLHKWEKTDHYNI
jgi:hypothetical protein